MWSTKNMKSTTTSFSRPTNLLLHCCRTKWIRIGSSSVRLKLFWGYLGFVGCIRLRWLIWVRMRIISCLRTFTTHILSNSEKKRPKRNRRQRIISLRCLKNRNWAWLKRFYSIELSLAAPAQKWNLRRRRVPQQWAAVANRKGRKWKMRILVAKLLQYFHSNRREWM